MTDAQNRGSDAQAQQKQSPETYIPALESMLEAAKKGEGDTFQALLDDLTSMREQALFREVGQLTRQLHEALSSFQLDSRLADVASDEFPDARHRLDQVIAITEESAHKTMDIVEDIIPRTDSLIERARGLGESLDAQNVQASVTPELEVFAQDVAEQATVIRSGLSEVIISQNYQDLSGQEIRKVIRLVTDVEETLINMIRVAGNSGMLVDRERAKDSPGTLPEGEQRITSQDEADELLSSLGF